ncbi:MAG: response regulator transcription factor [Leptospiraceae bacterium]|nr:response regulator transcription factor [Leptospiraceae bacterium]
MSGSKIHSGWEIGILEDDAPYRLHMAERLASMPEVAQVRCWPNAESLWHDPGKESLDLLIADLVLPGMSGLELIGLLNQQHPDIKCMVLSNVLDEEKIFEALKNGALGYVLKSELDSVERLIRTIMQGGAEMSPTIAFRVIACFQKKHHHKECLTHRERQILNEVVSGCSTRKIADLMGISVNTVKTHLKNIFKKLNVNSRIELLSLDLKNGRL